MDETNNNPLIPTSQENEIILYQPDSTIKMEVRLEGETVWLSQGQMAELFQKDRTVIGRHINNIFKEGELEESLVCAKFAHTKDYGRREGFTQRAETTLYSLDVIISVGYRVKSKRGTQFRQWANKVLKEYLLKGYAINQRLRHIEDKIDRRFSEYDRHLQRIDEKVDFFVRTSMPPCEGILYDGQIFDAYVLVCDLVRSAKFRVILVDNYIDESVLRQLDKRESGVTATIFTTGISKILQQDIERHNAQYAPIEIRTYKKAHDRFLIIDNAVYHIGASLKDLGKKLFAFSRMEMLSADELINHLERK